MIQERFPFHVIEGGRGAGPRLPDEPAPEIAAFTRLAQDFFTQIAPAVPARQRATVGFLYVWLTRETIGRGRSCVAVNWPLICEWTGVSVNVAKRAMDWLEGRGAVEWVRYPTAHELGVIRVHVPDGKGAWLPVPSRVRAVENPADNPVDGDGVSGGVHPSRADPSGNDGSSSSKLTRHAVTGLKGRKKLRAKETTRARARDDEPVGDGSSRAAPGAPEVKRRTAEEVDRVLGEIGRADPKRLDRLLAEAVGVLGDLGRALGPTNFAVRVEAARLATESPPCPGEVPGPSGDRSSPDGAGVAVDARMVPRVESPRPPGEASESPLPPGEG